MKFRIPVSELSSRLRLVSQAAARTATGLPILNHVLIVASKEWQQLQLAATDLSVGIVAHVDAQVEAPGAVALPAKLLGEFLRVMPEEGDVIAKPSRARAGSALRIICGDHQATIRGLDSKDFPEIPTAEKAAMSGAVPIPLPADELQQLVRRTVYAAAEDESRPILQGALVEIVGDEGITFAAADGFRLAVARSDYKVGRDVRAIIPASALAQAVRLSDGATTELYLDERQALFRAGNDELSTQLIEGNYPDYHQIVPKEHSVRTVFKAEEMIQALRIAGLFARDRANIVALAVLSREIQVSARAVETGEANVPVPAEAEGGDPVSLEIAFNYQYLIDALTAVGADEVALELSGEMTPGVLRPVDGNSCLSVLMPMHLA